MNIGQFSNPLNVLQRAEEHVEVGQKQVALVLLYETLNYMINKRSYGKDKEETMRLFHTWSPTHEQIVRLFVRLCVDLRDAGMVRDGLQTYRTIADKVPRSLESVIKYLFDLADERLAAVMSTNKANNILDDLEEGSTPEALLLATVTSERERGRAEGANLVSLWLTFSWEVLRNVLDLIKVNPGLETAYHSTAHRALAFCKTHERKSEFKKLCGNLRLHFQDMIKFSKDGKLSTESLELHLATRFEQLKAATALHQWSEGFATIEDIHKILDLTQKKPPAQLMATYYSKLTQLFLMSGNLLFHAYASIALYDLTREKNKSLKADDLRAMANQVVLAGLSIPLPATSVGAASQSLDKERDRRLTVLLGFDSNPNRANVISTLASSRALSECSKEVRDLFAVLEQDSVFDPMGLVPSVAALIKWVRSDERLKVYAAYLDELVVVRLLGALARVYSKMYLAQLHGLTAQLGFSFVDTERALLKAVRARQLSQDVRIDHASKTLAFASRVNEDERVKTTLAIMARRLSSVVALVDPASAAAVSPVPLSSQRPAEGVSLVSIVADRKQRVAKRRAQVDAVVQWQARQRLEREEEARRVRAEAEALKQHQAQEEQRRRDNERRERMENEIRLQNRLQASGVDLPSAMSLEEKERKVKELLEKKATAQREAEKKAHAKLKRLDVFVRAVREAERPLLHAKRATHAVEDRKAFEAHQQAVLEKARADHAQGLLRKQQLAAVMAHRSEFEELVMPIWRKSVEAQRQARANARAEAKMRDKMERARQRRDEALRQKKLEDEAARRAEAEAIRIREAEEEIRREQMLKEQREQQQQQQQQQQRDFGSQRDYPPQRDAPMEREPASQAPPAASAASTGSKYVPPGMRSSAPPTLSGRAGPPRVGDAGGPPRGRFGGDATPSLSARDAGPPRGRFSQDAPPAPPAGDQPPGATALWRRKGAA